MIPVSCQQKLLPHLVGLGYQYPVHWARRLSRPISRALRFRLLFPVVLHPILSRQYGSRFLKRWTRHGRSPSQSGMMRMPEGLPPVLRWWSRQSACIYRRHCHRNIFRGKHLGESITEEQLEVIRDGSFADLYVGDYWEINGVKYRIADINYWKNVGYPESEKVQKPHILIVPDTILGSGQMNTGNSTSGGYRSSAMKSTKLNQIADALPDTFKDMLISHRMFSDGSWIATSVDLMNEVMVHGTYICADNNNKQTSDAQQLSLFRLCPELKSIGQNYWLRNVAGSQTYTLISQYGDASSDMATSTYGIRPVFAIG